MSITREIVILAVTVDSDGQCDMTSVRRNILDGVEEKRIDSGLTAESDESSMVTAVDVMDQNTAYVVISREQAEGAERIKTHGVRIDRDDAVVAAQFVADKLSAQYTEELKREINVSPLAKDGQTNGFALSVDDEGIVAIVEIHCTFIS